MATDTADHFLDWTPGKTSVSMPSLAERWDTVMTSRAGADPSDKVHG